MIVIHEEKRPQNIDFWYQIKICIKEIALSVYE